MMDIPHALDAGFGTEGFQACLLASGLVLSFFLVTLLTFQGGVFVLCQCVLERGMFFWVDIVAVSWRLKIWELSGGSVF